MTKQEADMPFPQGFESEAKRKAESANQMVVSEKQLNSMAVRIANVREGLQGMIMKIRLLSK